MEIDFNTALNKLRENIKEKTTEEIIGKEHFEKIKENAFEEIQ